MSVKIRKTTLVKMQIVQTLKDRMLAIVGRDMSTILQTTSKGLAWVSFEISYSYSPDDF